MSEIVAQNLYKSYGRQEVVNDISLTLSKGDHVGLVGPNGQGKTTLLKLLAGIEPPLSGQVNMRRGLRVGYLPQDPPALENVTLWDAMITEFADLVKMETELHGLADQLAREPENSRLLEQFGHLQAEFEHQDGYRYETRIKSVLGGLGFDESQYNTPLTHLSGGQRSRALLAALLLREPDVLFLDEPTNHLDLAATEWLEKWLLNFRGSLVVISHDRYLLDSVSEYIWEISFGRLESYRGNYSAYLKLRELRRDEQMKIWEAQQEHIQKTQDFIARYHAGQRSREAKGRLTRLERFLEKEAIDKPLEHKRMRLRFGPITRSGDRVINARELVAGYEPKNPLIKFGDFEIRRGERLAIIGDNGTGKTTLARTLMNDLPPLSGEAKLGQKVHIGYLPQTHDTLDGGKSVLDTVRDYNPKMTPEEVRTLLGGLLFHNEDAFKRIDMLSGGERSRVVLACLVARGANALILDEPTNHLDIPSQEILQDVLQDFPGTVIFVSHDRYLVQALATDILYIRKGSVHHAKGGWDAFLRLRAALEEERVAQRKKTGPPGFGGDRRRLRKRLETLETKIEKEEARLKHLMEEINSASASNDTERVRRLGHEYEHADAELKKMWAEYEELSAAFEE